MTEKDITLADVMEELKSLKADVKELNNRVQAQSDAIYFHGYGRAPVVPLARSDLVPPSSERPPMSVWDGDYSHFYHG